MTQTRQDKIKVIIADDHAILRKGLIQVISETPDMTVMGEAGGGVELMQKIRELDLDVVVMDVEMPEKSGWDVIVELKRERPKLPVIILSIFPEEDYAIKFLKAGAAGYLNKASAPELLVEAIRKVAFGGKFISSRLGEKIACDLNDDTTKMPHDYLSAREYQIFHMLASGTSVREIAESLNLGVSTISTYRTRILEKMNMKKNAQLTSYAFKNKLLQ
jgi:DNA-binding NarL/FixJ family response regulator